MRGLPQLKSARMFALALLALAPCGALAQEAQGTAPQAAGATAGQPLDTLQPGLATGAVQRYDRAAALLRQGEVQAAKEQVTSLTRDYPSYYRALVLLAKTSEPEREKKVALDALERAAKIQKDERIQDSEALYLLAELYHAEGELVKAEKTYLRAAELKASNTPQQNARIFNGLGNVYLELKQVPKGEAHLEIAAEQFGSTAAQQHLELRKTRAKMDQEMERADRAIKDQVKSAYDITTTLPLPAAEDPRKKQATPAPAATPTPAPAATGTAPADTQKVGAGSVNQ